jgi:hypothetical protein
MPNRWRGVMDFDEPEDDWPVNKRKQRRSTGTDKLPEIFARMTPLFPREPTDIQAGKNRPTAADSDEHETVNEAMPVSVRPKPKHDEQDEENRYSVSRPE